MGKSPEKRARQQGTQIDGRSRKIDQHRATYTSRYALKQLKRDITESPSVAESPSISFQQFLDRCIMDVTKFNPLNYRDSWLRSYQTALEAALRSDTVNGYFNSAQGRSEHFVQFPEILLQSFTQYAKRHNNIHVRELNIRAYDFAFRKKNPELGIRRQLQSVITDFARTCLTQHSNILGVNPEQLQEAGSFVERFTKRGDVPSGSFNAAQYGIKRTGNMK